MSKYYPRASMLHLKIPVNITANKFCSNGKKLFGKYYKKYAYKSFKIQGADGTAVNVFEKMMSERRKQAERSIIVSSHRNDSVEKLFTWSSQFGTIKHIFVRKSKPNDILVEYVAPWQQRNHFLEFRENNVPSKNTYLKQMPPVITVDHKSLDTGEIHNLLATQDSLDKQILEFYRSCRMDDFEARMKFIAALQMEKLSREIFKDTIVYPFGSSVNGLGQANSDLDLMLEYRFTKTKTKTDESRERSKSQYRLTLLADHMETVSYINVCNIQSILNTTVPIIKYEHDFLNLNVDLAMNNRDGCCMSELIYSFGEIDARVRPLMLFVRWWAKIVGITNSIPGERLSSFGLASLVIFFLQQLDQPILPSARDLQKQQFQTKNVNTLSELLLEFFHFYRSFNFHECALAIYTATLVEKPGRAAIYVINPIDGHRNITKVVTPIQRDFFQTTVCDAYSKLGKAISRKRESKSYWGILTLFEKDCLK